MKKLREVFRLKFELGYSNRQIGTSVNISPGTVSEYLSLFRMTELDWSKAKQLDDEKLEQLVYRHPNKADGHRPQPNWETIHLELKRKGVTLLLLWKEYREQEPDGLGYTQFTKRYRAYKNTLEPAMRLQHKAGDKIFVDYCGLTIPWHDHATGLVHKAQVFVGCLGGSSLIYSEATQTQQLPDWIASHVRMFDFFDGVSATLVPDNLKSGIHKAHRYDPDLNPTYQALAEHYNIAVIPTRIISPKDKAKVEVSVQCVERQIIAALRHQRFGSVTEINRAINTLLEVLNNRPMQRINISRREQFEIFEKKALKALPKQRFELQQWRQAKVHIDYHICVDKSFYSVPFGLIQKQVDVCMTKDRVEIFYQSRRVALHTRSHQSGLFQTVEAHMPEKHRYYKHQEQDSSVEYLKSWAKSFDQHTISCVENFFKSRRFPQQAIRSVLGLKRLAEKYGKEQFEAACKKANELCQYRYRTIENILKHQLSDLKENKTKSNTQLPEKHFRGSNYYK